MTYIVQTQSHLRSEMFSFGIGISYFVTVWKINKYIFVYVLDNLILIGGCKGTEHGCCPDGVTAAEGPEYLGCPAKDSIPRGACLETEFGCCHDGVNAAQGPFNFGCPDYTCAVSFLLFKIYRS